jgi:transcriptional regulator with XRE-family HTH domain
MQVFRCGNGEGKRDGFAYYDVKYYYPPSTFSSPMKTDSELIDAARDAIDRKGIKLAALAKELGITYRSLQNYLYKRSRMPISVYLGICEATGMPPNYPNKERFDLDFYAFREALERGLGGWLSRVRLDPEQGIMLDRDVSKEGPAPRNTINAVIIGMAAVYDTVLQQRFDSRASDDEGDDADGP